MRLALAALLLVSAAPALALARVERFAVIVGNNRGSSDDVPLRYAEADATRVHDVLLELGDFSPLNTVLLRGQDVAHVRAALLAINERIRELRSSPDVQVALFVYYSGHADARALHLGGGELELSELRQHASGSAANFRLVVLDACRSGAFTRVKGGERALPFALPAQTTDALPGDGFAFLTASSANEDAQESDELQGALFTHAFVSGLLGAADSDGDGAVVLDEVYRYAYEATLRATSRTFVGTQHPTFHYDLRGRGSLVLTRPRAYSAQRANVDFPPKLAFLLLRDNADGPVSVDLAASDRPRRLSLPPARYFVRARASDVMYEGTIDAASGTTQAIDIDHLSRIDYARLVRKGARPSRFAHGPETGVSMRSALPNADSACFGAFVGYAVELTGFGVSARFNSCASELHNGTLLGTVLAHDLELGFHHAWDISLLTLRASLGPGLSLFDQRFQTRGSAPPRIAAAPFIGLGLDAQLDLSHGWYTSLGAAGQTHFLRMVDPNKPDGRLAIAFALRTTLAFGKHF
jgi:hypothetical protein